MKPITDDQIAKGMRETAQLHPCDRPGEMHAWRPARAHGDLVVLLWTERSRPGVWHLSASSSAAPLSAHDQAELRALFGVPEQVVATTDQLVRGGTTWDVCRWQWEELPERPQDAVQQNLLGQLRDRDRR